MAGSVKSADPTQEKLSYYSKYLVEIVARCAAATRKHETVNLLGTPEGGGTNAGINENEKGDYSNAPCVMAGRGARGSDDGGSHRCPSYSNG